MLSPPVRDSLRTLLALCKKRTSAAFELLASTTCKGEQTRAMRANEIPRGRGGTRLALPYAKPKRRHYEPQPRHRARSCGDSRHRVRVQLDASLRTRTSAAGRER